MNEVVREIGEVRDSIGPETVQKILQEQDMPKGKLSQLKGPISSFWQECLKIDSFKKLVFYYDRLGTKRISHSERIKYRRGILYVLPIFNTGSVFLPQAYEQTILNLLDEHPSIPVEFLEIGY